MRSNKRDGERSRNLTKRIENNRQLVKTTGDPYDDTLKLTLSFVNKLNIPSFRGTTISDNKTKDEEVRTNVEDEPATANSVSIRKGGSGIDSIVKSPKTQPYTNYQTDSEVQMKCQKGDEVSKKSSENVRNPFVRLLSWARSKSDGPSHSCTKRDCGRCNLISRDYLTNT